MQQLASSLLRQNAANHEALLTELASLLELKRSQSSAICPNSMLLAIYHCGSQTYWLIHSVDVTEKPIQVSVVTEGLILSKDVTRMIPSPSEKASLST